MTSGAAPSGKAIDQKIEEAIGLQLRIGVMASAAVVLLGGILYFVEPSGPRLGYHNFRGAAGALSHPAVILHGALGGDSRSIIQLGLLLLIATPIARVVFAVAGFLFERDWLYVAVSLLVLAILLYSLVFGH
jgi:uncharacterized membrane protein